MDEFEVGVCMALMVAVTAAAAVATGAVATGVVGGGAAATAAVVAGPVSAGVAEVAVVVAALAAASVRLEHLQQRTVPLSTAAIALVVAQSLQQPGASKDLHAEDCDSAHSCPQEVWSATSSPEWIFDWA